jgi:hypothetical protein
MDAVVAKLVLLEALELFAQAIALDRKRIDHPASRLALGREKADAPLQVAPAGNRRRPPRGIEDEECRHGADNDRDDGRNGAGPVYQGLVHGVLPQLQGRQDPVQPLGKRIHRRPHQCLGRMVLASLPSVSALT